MRNFQNSWWDFIWKERKTRERTKRLKLNFSSILCVDCCIALVLCAAINGIVKLQIRLIKSTNVTQLVVLVDCLVVVVFSKEWPFDEEPITTQSAPSRLSTMLANINLLIGASLLRRQSDSGQLSSHWDFLWIISTIWILWPITVCLELVQPLTQIGLDPNDCPSFLPIRLSDFGLDFPSTEINDTAPPPLLWQSQRHYLQIEITSGKEKEKHSQTYRIE